MNKQYAPRSSWLQPHCEITPRNPYNILPPMRSLLGIGAQEMFWGFRLSGQLFQLWGIPGTLKILNLKPAKLLPRKAQQQIRVLACLPAAEETHIFGASLSMAST